MTSTPNEVTLPSDAQLVAIAIAASKNAYVPYSHFPVGAALLTRQGQVYSGVNIENASYSATICAERSAVVQAVSAGEREFAVVSNTAGSPCGVCRQVLSEFGLDTRVIIADLQGNIRQVLPIGELLPQAFLPHDVRPPNES